MNNIGVWAPFAKQVSLAYQGHQYPMTQLETGWWHTLEITLAEDADYGFFVDGLGPYPDPRSPYQPNGVHGLSRTVNHADYIWHDTHWRAPPFASAIVYEMHIGTFTEEGTFEAAIERLDALCDLGITHIELMPVAEFSGTRGWGYDGVQLFAPHHHYGQPNSLKKLVDACHKKGLAVLLDVVYNHLGPTGNYLAQYGSYFTHRYNTPWGDAINFDDAHSDQVRHFFIDNALMWLRDYHFDGLRLDAIHAIYDQSAMPFLSQLTNEVQILETQTRKSFTLVAESDLNDTRILSPSIYGGLGFHSQWSDDFHHALHALLTGERTGYYTDFGQLAHMAKAMTHGFVYDGCYSNFRQRNHGSRTYGLKGRQLLAYSQTHDQVGNRARGERLSQLLNADQLKIAAALVLTSPFVPMIFQGEEWAASSPFLYFTDHQEPALAKAVKEGRQREFAAFGWSPQQVPDPQAFTSFECSKLQWQECTEPQHASMRDWYKAIIKLRRSHPSLQNDALEGVQVEYSEDQKWLKVLRGMMAMFYNFSDRTQQIECGQCLTMNILLKSHPNIRLQGESITLPAMSTAILSDTF